MKTRFMNSAESCNICYEGIHMQGKVDCCKHVFCFQCIRKWSETENSCPLCKARFFTITKVHRRKYYLNSKPKSLKIVVGGKDQNSGQEFLTLLQAAERILTHELHRLFQNA